VILGDYGQTFRIAIDIFKILIISLKKEGNKVEYTMAARLRVSNLITIIIVKESRNEYC